MLFRSQRVTAGKPEFISAGHFTLPGTRTGFQLLHGTKVPSMRDWQTQMAGLVQTAPEDRTNPFNLGVSALLTPFRHFLQNARVILSSFDAFRMEAFTLITAYFSFYSTRKRSKPVDRNNALWGKRV